MTLAERSAFLPSTNRERLVWGAFAACVALVGVLFWDAIANLFHRWDSQKELSHSYFIPLISAWLVWENRTRVRASIGDPSFAGVAIAVAGMGSFLVGQLTSIFLFQQIGLVIVVAGLVAGFGGLSLLRTTAAPVAFLFFAVPPPFWVITVLSWNFQEWSSILGVWMIEAMGIPVFLSGNIIDLGEYKLQVAEACSGLRYLFPFLSIGVMAGYMYRGPVWQRLAIVVSTIPITILMNSFRIAVTGALVQATGPEHAEGALHFFEGWVVFIICLLMLFGVIALLARLKRPKQTALDAMATPELPQSTPSRSKAAQAALAILPAVFLAGIFLASVVKVDALTIPEREVFAFLPAEFDGARTEIRPIEPAVAETLGADDAIVLDVSEASGDAYNLYIAYLEAQRDGRSWHSPRQCIPGGGWKITTHDVVESTAGDGRAFNYNRLIIENGNYRQLVYYWYDQRGRKVANEFVMKLWLIVDAVTRNRSDGAMVRLIASVPPDGSLEDAERVLQSATKRLEGFLPEYVPY